jgi:hypothetical protein
MAGFGQNEVEMQTHKTSLVGLLIALVALAALWSACSDDDEILCADPTADPTLENIWPNADGTYWTYKVTVHIRRDLEEAFACDSLYNTAEEVPPAPSLDEVSCLLENHAVADEFDTEIATFRMEFAGDTTSSQGVTGQNLRELVSPSGGGAPAQPGGRISPLLAGVYAARPDLRAAIEQQVGTGGASSLAPGTSVGLLGAGCFSYACPLLIHGGVWRKTEEWIGVYTSLDTLPAWKFLEADLSDGHEFTHQLIPLLAPDVVLHCRVVGERRAKTDMCTFRKALDCIYLVDYGVGQLLGPGALRYYRAFDYGRVLYVPEVGPVYVYERMLACVSDPMGLGVGERTTSLKATGTSAP